MWGPGVEISSRRLRRRQDSAVAHIREIQIAGETIRLGQLLKLAGIARSGGEAKLLLSDGVRVNGAAESRRGRQLRRGDTVEAEGEAVKIA
jgi:ribosome-associated protein